jgi:hypothetical protein
VREVNFPADISHCLPAYDRATGARRDPSASRRTIVHNPAALEMMGTRTVRGEEVVAPGMTDDEPDAGQGIVWAEAPPARRRAMVSFMETKTLTQRIIDQEEDETTTIIIGNL